MPVLLIFSPTRSDFSVQHRCRLETGHSKMKTVHLYCRWARRSSVVYSLCSIWRLRPSPLSSSKLSLLRLSTIVHPIWSSSSSSSVGVRMFHSKSCEGSGFWFWRKLFSHRAPYGQDLEACISVDCGVLRFPFSICRWPKLLRCFRSFQRCPR